LKGATRFGTPPDAALVAACPEKTPPAAVNASGFDPKVLGFRLGVND
jgi:hypothetical protein